jgi:ABC-type tungstate transport system substrate-binding protein
VIIVLSTTGGCLGVFGQVFKIKNRVLGDFILEIWGVYCAYIVKFIVSLEGFFILHLSREN